MYLVSGCLLGFNCKYDGGNNLCEAVRDFAASHSCFTVCPETAGGLSAPRPPAEQRDGGVFDREGRDLTDAFRLGSERCFKAAASEAERRGESIEGAVLKARSPSCGCGRIYDGTFTGSTTDGNGIFTALLIAHGIPVYTEETLKTNFR